MHCTSLQGLYPLLDSFPIESPRRLQQTCAGCPWPTCDPPQPCFNADCLSLFQQQCTTQVLQAIWQMSCNSSRGACALQQASRTVHLPNDWALLHESLQQCTRPCIHPPLGVFGISPHKHTLRKKKTYKISPCSQL